MTESAKIQKIGYLLNQNKEKIAKEVVNAVFSTNKLEILEKYDLTHAKVYEFAKYDISKLFTSIISERPEIFAKYIAWQRSMMETREVPLILVKMNLAILKQIVKSIINYDSYYIIEDYFTIADNELQKHLPEPDSFIDINHPFGVVARKYIDYLLANNKSKAIELIIDTLNSGVSLSDILVSILQPAQYEVGMLWQYNRITVAKEHFVTEVTREAIVALNPYIEKLPKNGNYLISACLSGELHDMGLRFVTEYFKINGWETLYFGADTPKHDLLKEIQTVNPEIIAISATTSSQLHLTKSLIEKIRLLNIKSKIIVGGYVFNQAHGIYEYVEPDGYAPDAVTALNIAYDLLKN